MVTGGGAARERVAEILEGIGETGAFATRLTAPPAELDIEVRGAGPVRLPVSAAGARRLVSVARPARYGRREETVLDERVRATWEVPKSRVRIDKRRWNWTLRPALKRIRRDLGLAEGVRLRAELHSMLVYAPGHFFLPHRDSEKADEMVGTLVVTLPSSYRGGALLVEHRGERREFRGSKRFLSLVAFYADCRHEARPVKEGYRVVLTYNLLLAGVAGAADAPSSLPGADRTALDRLVAALVAHFETPRPPPRWRGPDAPTGDPPDRLVCLLDHQYTERGLAWERLKGEDAARAAALRAAAEETGCEAALALAEVHECWSCERDDDGWYGSGYGRSARWERDEDDGWWEDGGFVADDPDDYALLDLQDWSVTLDRWVAPGEEKVASVSTSVRDDELCWTTPTSSIEPYASEYEGYMGNWGNTMDRWYRRAAIVIWPRSRAFAVRAEASPAWALDVVAKRIRAGAAAEARELVSALLPEWRHRALREKHRGFLARVLRVAEGIDDPDLAARLLEPFRLEELTLRHAGAFAALAGRYGGAWTAALLSTWSSDSRGGRAAGAAKDPGVWVSALPRLIEALLDSGKEGSAGAAGAIVEDRWRWIERTLGEVPAWSRPREREETLRRLGAPVLSVLDAAARAGDGARVEAAVADLVAVGREDFLPCLLGALDAAEGTVAPERWEALGLESLRLRCVAVLEARLSEPERARDDWSIPFDGGCGCELCATLADFLAAPDRRRLEWPLRKDRRQHVHGTIDARELPVTHRTRRQGSPHVLVLDKTEALFEGEAAARRGWREALARLHRPGAPPER